MAMLVFLKINLRTKSRLSKTTYNLKIKRSLIFLQKKIKFLKSLEFKLHANICVIA
jgi:hypothetical protein